MALQQQEKEYVGASRWLSLQHSLVAHWLFVSFILLALVPIIGFDDVWSADVGAQLAQSQQLADGGGWHFSHPLPEADPQGEWFTFHFSGRAGDDYVVLAKHPAYSWLVAGLLKAGGHGMVMAFSALSTSTAALGVAMLARTSVSKRSSVAMLWIVATMSPLVFDGYLGYAHTLAAALAIWSLVAIVCHIRSTRLVHYGLPVSCALAAAGAFVRSESVLAGLALGLALMATSGRWWTVRQRRLSFVGGILVAASTGAGFVVDRLITVQVDSYLGDVASPVGWLPGRFQGFNATWLWADSSGWRSQDLLLIGAPICWFLAAQIFGRSKTRLQQARLQPYVLAGAVLIAVWWVLDPRHVVPGLLLAFPLLVFLARLIPSDISETPVPAIGLVAFVLFAGAVILTQYPQGGTAEWGGRYFAAGVPFALVGLSTALSRLVDVPNSQLLRWAGPPAVASLLLVSAGLGGLRHSKQLVGQLGSSVDAVTATSEPSGRSEDVVIVSTSNAVGRLLWKQTSAHPWLLVPPEDLGQAMSNLDDVGVDRVVVIAERNQETDRTIGTYVDVEVVEPWATSPVEILAFNAE